MPPAAGAAGAGAVLCLQNDEKSEAHPAAPGEVARSNDEGVERLEAEMRMLSARFAEITRDFQQLRTSSERTPVLDKASATAPPGTAGMSIQKEQVATIMTQLREEERRRASSSARRARGAKWRNARSATPASWAWGLATKRASWTSFNRP